VGKLDDMLRYAAAVERQSEHPLAAATVAYATERRLELPEVVEFGQSAGDGVWGTVEGCRVEVGRAGWLATRGVDPRKLEELEEVADATGASSVLVAVDGRAVGAILVRDVERQSTVAAVESLAAEGLEVWLVSGDRRSVVEAMAQRLGIQHVIGEARPLDKARLVREASGRGRVVALVGDGVNDAPALAEADVGIAIGGASAVSASAAAFALTTDDLLRVPEALALARATLRVIRQNLAWAFLYNVLALPLAAVGVVPPMWGAGLMAASSLSVLLSSLRLKRFTWTPPEGVHLPALKAPPAPPT